MRIRTSLALALCLTLAACGGASHAGTYTMDLDAFADAMASKMPKGMPGADKAMEEMKKGAKGTLVLNADKTWTMTLAMKIMGQAKTKEGAGTYTLEGDKISMTGKEKGEEKEETVSGTIKDGVITVSQDGMTMTFKKS